MKRVVKIFGMVSLVMSVVLSFFVTSVFAGTWQEVAQSQVKHRTTAVGFINETQGITAGYAGEVHYSDDGGQTWPRAVNQSMCRYGLDVVSENLAVTVGNGGNVRISKDGGKTWQAVANVKDKANSASFIDETTGWVASRTLIWATTDGGGAWSDVQSPEDARSFIAVSLRTATDGYVLDMGGTLYITNDGGQTWTSQKLPLDKKIFSSLAVGAAPSAAVRFTDAMNGVIVLSPEGEGLVALRTADGGQTWTKEAIAMAAGGVFLTHDGNFVTVYMAPSQIKVFRHQPS